MDISTRFQLHATLSPRLSGRTAVRRPLFAAYTDPRPENDLVPAEKTEKIGVRPVNDDSSGNHLQ